MSDINVVSKTQRIIVDPFSSSVAIISAGPQGPRGAQGAIGPPGPGTPSEYLRADGTVPATGPLVVPNAALDTHALNRGAANGLYLPVATNYAKGQVAYAQITANVTLNTTALTDIPGLSITYTCEANRRYRVKSRVAAQGTVANDVVRFVLLADAASVELTQWAMPLPTSFFGPFYMEKSYNTGIAAGSHTFKVQGYRQAGTGAPVLVTTATYACFIELEDIGPV